MAERPTEGALRTGAKRLYWAMTFQLRARLREQRAAERIRASDFFDEAYYLEHNPDVAEAGIDPVQHYVAAGCREGRSPHPLFDGDRYLAENPDVAASGRNPLDHFAHEGWEEGRSPRELFCAPEEPPPPPPPVLPLPESAPERDGPTIRLSEICESSPHDRAQRHDPVVVVISHVCPWPPRAGNEYRIKRYVEWLGAHGHRVIYVCAPLGGEELDDERLARVVEEHRDFIHCGRAGDVKYALADDFACALAPIEGSRALPLSEEEATIVAPEVALRPEVAAYELAFCSDVLLRVLMQLDRGLPDPCLYVTSYAFNTRHLPLLRPERTSIIDTIDVFSSKHEKVQGFGVDDGLVLTPEEERALLLRGDVVMAIQPDEARSLAALVPERRVIDVGVDFDPLPDDYAALPGAEAPKRVLLLGSANPMNVRGLEDVIAFVWPLVVREHPDAELLVGGALSQHVPREVPNVVPLGFVDSLAELYRDCHLVINPAVAGTGIKIKTLECLASWRPIVTWPAGVDGLPHELRSLCTVVTDLYEFHLEIVKALSQDRREAFDFDTRERVRLALSGRVVYRELDEVVAESFDETRPETDSP